MPLIPARGAAVCFTHDAPITDEDVTPCAAQDAYGDVMGSVPDRWLWLGDDALVAVLDHCRDGDAATSTFPPLLGGVRVWTVTRAPLITHVRDANGGRQVFS